MITEDQRRDSLDDLQVLSFRSPIQTDQQGQLTQPVAVRQLSSRFLPFADDDRAKKILLTCGGLLLITQCLDQPLQ